MRLPPVFITVVLQDCWMQITMACADVPIFDKGFLRGQDTIELTASVSQDKIITEALGGGTVPASYGVYMPDDGACLTEAYTSEAALQVT